MLTLIPLVTPENTSIYIEKNAFHCRLEIYISCGQACSLSLPQHILILSANQYIEHRFQLPYNTKSEPLSNGITTVLNSIRRRVERQQTPTMNRDHFSALPVHIRHHILTYLESEFVKRDEHGNVRYIGQAALGDCITEAQFKLESFQLWRRHRFAKVSRQFRQDFLDVFFSLNKFEFGSGPLLIEFLDTMLDDRRMKQLTSLRFTLRIQAWVPPSADRENLINLMRRIYRLFFLCVNLKELEIRAQVHWKNTDGLTESITVPMEDALSYFQGTFLNKRPMSFGGMIENAPRRHGYDEDPRRWLRLGLPSDLGSKNERVQGILASAYDMVMKERQEQQRQEQKSR